MASDRSAVVTGCGAGIGRAIFQRLNDDGYVVVGIERDQACAEEMNSALAGHGEVIVGDVAEPGVLERAADRAKACGLLSAWVNNAGIALRGDLLSTPREDVDRLISVNLMGYYWGCAAAVRAFIDGDTPGAIVNISSVHGRVSYPGWAAYDVAKGGVDALTRYVAIEYGARGIRANAIAPGAVHTPMNDAFIAAAADPAAEVAAMRASIPLRREAEPTEIAAVAAYLLSSESSYITGQSIAVDGGYTAAAQLASSTTTPPPIPAATAISREDEV